jgi:hypothetical protein
VLLAALILGGSPAIAAPRGARAEEYVAAANRAFRAGEYDRALAELEVGYAIEPRREFLITFAQVYAAMGRLDDAIDRCERYLVVAPGSPLAGSVRQLVRGWRRQLDDQDEQQEHDAPAVAKLSVERTVVAAPVAPKPQRSTVTQPTTTPAPTPAPTPTPARDHRRRVTWMLVGGAAVVVIGVSLGVGLGLGLRDDTPATKLGTIGFH